MAKEINQGDIALCKKSLVSLKDGMELFTKGEYYDCPHTNCILDNSKNRQYGWNADMIEEHFYIFKAGEK